MSMLKTAFFWFFCFTILFLLCLDFWAWTESPTWMLFGLPSWIFYFIGLQLLMAIALTIFANQYWQTTDPNSEDITTRDP